MGLYSDSGKLLLSFTKSRTLVYGYRPYGRLTLATLGLLALKKSSAVKYSQGEL